MQSPQANPLDALKGGFRRACVKRLVGDEPGAIEVLRDEIPKLVVAWAKSTTLGGPEKKAKLKELFDDESSRAEELAVAFDLFAGRFEARVASIVRQELEQAASRLDEVTVKLERGLRELPVQPEPEVVLAAQVESVPVETSLPAEPSEGVPQELPEETEEVEEVEETEGVEEELDPPRGIGLRFDEIEEMIDEVLDFGES